MNQYYRKNQFKQKEFVGSTKQSLQNILYDLNKSTHSKNSKNSEQPKITPLQLHKLKQAYLLYCKQTNQLARADIGPLLRSLGIVISNFDVNKILAQMNVGKSININTFVQIYVKTKNSRGNINEVQDAINMLGGGKAELDVQKLKNDLTNLGDIIKAKQFDEIMKLVGTKDGTVNAKRLINFLMSFSK